MSHDTSYSLEEAEDALYTAMESVATMWQQLNSADFQKNYEAKNGRAAYNGWRARALTAYDFKTKEVKEIRAYIGSKFKVEYKTLQDVQIAIRERGLVAPDWMNGNSEEGAPVMIQTQTVEAAVIEPEEIQLSLQSQKDHAEILERLIEARKQANLSQAEVSAHFGFVTTTVGSWERGKSPVTLINIFKLAALYNVDALWILTGEREIAKDELINIAKYLDISLAHLKQLIEE